MLACAALAGGLGGCSLMTPQPGETGAAGTEPAGTQPASSGPADGGTPGESSEPAPETPPATDPGAGGSPPSTSGESCTDGEAPSHMTGEEALATWAGELDPPFEDQNVSWATDDADPSTYDPCQTLSWIVVPVENGTASSPHQIMLFHDGRYVGPATKAAHGYWPTVLRLDQGVIEVTWTFPEEGDSAADPTGLATATYTWSDEAQHVQQNGSTPTSG